MHNRKCPECGECLDLRYAIDGTIIYLCFLCGDAYSLGLQGVLKLGKIKPVIVSSGVTQERYDDGISTFYERG